MSATAEWTDPSTRPIQIENLVSGVDRYNPSNGSILEDYLYHQIRENEYDCLANLAILKLYQFNPSLYNSDVVINVLIKSLTAVPFPDFNLCLALLERPIIPNTDEPDPLPDLLPLLTKLHELLLQSQFPAFWQFYKSSELQSLREDYTVECKGFDDNIRNVVIKSVRSTFKKINIDRLSTYLDLSGDELISFITELGWTIDGSVVTVAPNADNQIEATVVRENIQLAQLSKIIAHSVKAS